MGVTVRQRGRIPIRTWDAKAMREVALAAQAIIVTRAFRDGKGLADQPHKPYSTRPLTVTFASDTGRRLKPKGGEPVRGRSPGATKSGRRRVGPIIGRRYPGGYAQYKTQSRRTRGEASVDLTLSGQLRRSFRIKSVTVQRAVIGLTGEPAVYGTFANRLRPWIGFSPNDRRILADAYAAAIAGAIERGRRGAR